jgi:hypothetical protein
VPEFELPEVARLPNLAKFQRLCFLWRKSIFWKMDIRHLQEMDIANNHATTSHYGLYPRGINLTWFWSDTHEFTIEFIHIAF